MDKKIKLGDICEVVSGSTPKTNRAEYWDGDIDWITPAELSDETYIINESVRKITQQAVSGTGLKSFPAGTVILSSRAPIGKVAIAGKEMYCNQGFKNLICSEKISNIYLYWFLKSNTQYLNSLGRGATFKEISKSIVEGIEILLPPMDEQLERAKTLKKCWDIINLRKQELKMLDDLVKARFVEMFGDPIKNNKSYRQIPLAQLCDVGSSKRIFEKEYVDEGVPFYRTKEVVELSKGNDISTELFITRERFEEIRNKYGVPQKNDLLISAVGTIGVIWIVDGKSDFYFKDGNLLRIASSSKFDSVYMKYLLESLIANYKQQMSVGTAYAALTIAGLKQMQIYDVPLSMQHEFAVFVEKVSKAKAVVQKALDNTQMLFDSLMQKYFG